VEVEEDLIKQLTLVYQMVYQEDQVVVEQEV
jgi:hypothetical protein